MAILNNQRVYLYIYIRILPFYLAFFVAFYLTSGAQRWGPASPTEIWSESGWRSPRQEEDEVEEVGKNKKQHT